jgi:hypothetical protein
MFEELGITEVIDQATKQDESAKFWGDLHRVGVISGNDIDE